MRSAVILVSAAVTALLLFAGIPLVSDGSDATSYVGDDKITICGYAEYDAALDITPEIMVFVVYTTTEGKFYVNVNDGKLISATVNGTDGNEKNHYFFSIGEVPLINSPAAEYYICAFNNFKINSVSSFIEAERVTIHPDEESWGAIVAVDWDAWMIKHDDPWSETPAGATVWVTGQYIEPSGGDPGYLSGDHITMKTAMGAVKGHVDGIIGNKTENLNDVLVQFLRNGSVVASTRTNSDGDYSLTVPTGYYTVKFSRGNYECDPIPFTVTEGTNTVPGASMTLTVSEDYFGYDLAHFLTIIGGAVCATIIFISIAFQWRRIKRNKSGKDWILDDQQEMDGLDEDE